MCVRARASQSRFSVSACERGVRADSPDRTRRRQRLDVECERACVCVCRVCCACCFALLFVSVCAAIELKSYKIVRSSRAAEAVVVVVLAVRSPRREIDLDRSIELRWCPASGVDRN